jgi:acyl carrier protein
MERGVKIGIYAAAVLGMSALSVAQADEAPRSKPSAVESRVIKIIADQFRVESRRITRSTHLVKDLGADDLDRVEIVMDLEEAFNLTIEDKEVEKFETVGQFVDHVTKALGKRKPPSKPASARP